MDHLIMAFEAKKEQEGSSYSVHEDRTPFGTVFRDISRESGSWPEEVVGLGDGKNWNTRRLRKPSGESRRPKVYISVEKTSKGNLALNWFPRRGVGYPSDNGDWIRWDDQWPVGGFSYPFNRILFIHDFVPCFSESHFHTLGEAEGYLAEAVRDLVGNVLQFLRHFIEVEILDHIFLEYSETEDFLDRRFLGVAIRDAAEHEQEREERKRQEWLTITFDEQLGIRAEDLLRAFDAAGHKYAPTARKLGPHLREGATLSSDKVKRLLGKLCLEFPKLYDSVLGDASSTQHLGNVVELEPRRKP